MTLSRWTVRRGVERVQARETLMKWMTCWRVWSVLVALCIIGGAHRVSAQSGAALTGTVVDQSGGALVGATVTIESATGTRVGKATTDASGTFTVSNLAPGNYDVHVEQKMFATAHIDIELKAGVAPDPLRVVLSVSGVNEVVDIEGTAAVTRSATTATKTAASLFDTPVAVSLVPRELLDAQKAASLKDALQNVSSVATDNSGNSGNRFIIRGFSNNGVVMRDSLPAVTAASFRTDFDDYNIDRIEVLKGPASVLFGRSQPGGIINMVTTTPQAQTVASIEQRLGSYDQRRTVVHFSAPVVPNKTLLFRVDAVYEDSNSFRDFVLQGRKGINPKLTWRPGASTELNVSYERIHMNYQFDGGQIAIGRTPADLPITRSLFGDPNNDPDVFNQGYTSTDFTQRFGKHWSLHHRFVRNMRDSTDVEINALNSTTPLLADGRTMQRSLFSQYSDTRLYSTNLELLGDFSIGPMRHQTLVGFDYLYDYTRYSAAGLYNTAATANPILNLDVFAPVYNLPASIFAQTLDTNLSTSHNRSVYFNKNYGLYVQDQITLFKTLHVLLGGREDKANTSVGSAATTGLDWTAAEQNRLTPARQQFDKAFSPRAGVVYQFVPWLGGYTSYTRSFGPNNGQSTNGDRFPPQRGTQVEVGLKGEWFKGNLSATLASYTLKQTNLLIADLSTPDPTDAILAGDRRSKGVELDVLGRLTDNLTANVSYSYTAKAWVEGDNPPSLGGVAGNTLANVPRHRGSVWLAYSLKGKMREPVKLGLGTFFSGWRYGNIQNTLDLAGYTRVDGSAAYTFSNLGRSKLTVQLNVRNLFNKKYYEYANSFVSIFPGQPRSAIVSANIAF